MKCRRRAGPWHRVSERVKNNADLTILAGACSAERSVFSHEQLSEKNVSG
jgi:hypothetical protein